MGHPVAAHGRVASISFSGHFLKGHPVSSWLLLCILVLWSSYPIGRKEGRKESHKKDPKSVLVATALHPEIGNSTFISSDKKREGEYNVGHPVIPDVLLKVFLKCSTVCWAAAATVQPNW